MSKIIYPDLSYNVQGAIYDVYNELCHLDISEKGWEKAFLIALEERNISAENQVEFALHYKGYRIGRFFVDVVADEKLLLELKVKNHLQPIDWGQTLTYLKVTGLKLGILVNFGGNELDFERIPNFISEESKSRPESSAARTTDGLLYPQLTRELRAILYDVHNELGPGFMHMHYRRAIQIELRRRDFSYRVRKEVKIQFHGQPIETRETRLLIVDDKLILTPIAVREITPKIEGRLRQYLKLLGFELGFVANFHAPSLEIVPVRISNETED